MAVAVATEFALPVVATNEVVFLTADDFDAHEIRVAIHDGYTLMDKRLLRRYSPQQYLRSQEEMAELFADIPEALENTVEIAKRCNVTVRLGEYFLPNFPTGDMTHRRLPGHEVERGAGGAAGIPVPGSGGAGRAPSRVR